MTEKEWAKMDYDYNKTRKKLISALKKLDRELQLSSTITGAEHDAFWCLIFHIKSRYDYASLNWEIVQKEGDEK